MTEELLRKGDWAVYRGLSYFVLAVSYRFVTLRRANPEAESIVVLQCDPDLKKDIFRSSVAQVTLPKRRKLIEPL